MTTNNKEQGLQQLKSIHQIQVSGSIQNLLREIRQYKLQGEDYAKSIADFKKEQKAKKDAELKKSQPKEEEHSTTEIQVAKTVSIQPEQVKTTQTANTHDFANAQQKPKVQNDFRQNQNAYNNRNYPNNQNRGNFANQRPNNTYNNFNNSNNNQNRQFNNNQNRPFNPNPNNQNRTFNNNQNRPFNNQNRAFNNNTNNQNRPGGFQRPFDNTQRGDFKKPANKGGSFIPSKANNVRVFNTPLESSSVLAQPERNFGNKNKSQRSYEEKNKPSKKLLARRNIIIEDIDGFDETTMGSRKLIRAKKKQETFVAKAVDTAVITTETITVKNLSEKTGKPVSDIIKQLMILGVMATINSSIDFTTAELICGELGIKLEQKIEKTAEEELFEVADEEKDENLIVRPPVVAVMGHVDHGKTSLLDAIRKTNIVSGEAGGITQKIGAYSICNNDDKITFIDTPGHAAFTSMRARGAKVTDIAILVVAADDGIMPQTIEAINHIKAAGVPIIVAMNKMDKPEANPEKCKQQLSENGLLPEDWGGDTIIVPVSAKTGIGIDNLLNMIQLVAQIQELKANPNKLALAVVLEAELDKNRGPVATLIVQNGTLKVGDNMISGVTFGKIRAMFDENGKPLKEAGPSMPVSVLGFDEVPQSGDQVYVVNEKLSKQVIEERKQKIKQERALATSGVSLDDFMYRVNEGKLKNLNIIIKADTQGSVEALKQTLTAIRNEEVKVVCVHSGAGAVTESDLVLAQATNSIVINFNMKIATKISNMADNLKVELKDYKVIYNIVDDITRAISGMLTIKYEKVVIGHAEVRVVFKLSSVGVVAGSYITDGKATRHAGVRVIRADEEIADTTIDALKIQKDDKAEVNQGYECGIKLKDFSQIKEGDILEIYQNVEIKR